MPSGLAALMQILLAVIGAYVAAFWFCLVVWTFRDIQKRTRDVVVQILATLLVLLFNVPGLILYTILRPPETIAEAYARALEAERVAAQARTCPGCGAPTEPDFVLCPNCTTHLKQPCASCGRLMHLHWQTCPYCGAHAAPPEEPVPTEPAEVAR